MNIRYYIEQIEQQRKGQEAIYHNVAAKHGLSDTAMWVLYLVSEPEKVYTQQELCRQISCAKQTINTAIANLMKNGYVELEMIPGTRNQKKIILTNKGQELAASTTNILREAEERAYAKLSAKELEAYLEMATRLTMSLKEETEKM
ncbi:MAG: winged helix-turn-helix transcriptional regulator [Lachnospiraceae bacterium]|nr:winged helix-turn-helix transcriptional regulator [Lachnospiraceae bacterium]